MYPLMVRTQLTPHFEINHELSPGPGQFWASDSSGPHDMLGGSWNFDLVALHCRPLALHQTVLYVRDHLVNFVEEVSLSQWSILGGLIGRWGSTVEESIKHLE